MGKIITLPAGNLEKTLDIADMISLSYKVVVYVITSEQAD